MSAFVLLYYKYAPQITKFVINTIFEIKKNG